MGEEFCGKYSLVREESMSASCGTLRHVMRKLRGVERNSCWHGLPVLAPGARKDNVIYLALIYLVSIFCFFYYGITYQLACIDHCTSEFRLSRVKSTGLAL